MESFHISFIVKKALNKKHMHKKKLKKELSSNVQLIYISTPLSHNSKKSLFNILPLTSKVQASFTPFSSQDKVSTGYVQLNSMWKSRITIYNIYAS